MSVIVSGGRFGMEIISGIERRRRWRLEEKLRIVAEAEAPGAVFALVARRHDVSRGQLWKWRTQVRSGELTAAQAVPEFIPIRVLPAAAESVRQPRPADAPMNAPTSPMAPAPARAVESGARRIEIVLPDGTCVRVDDQVGAAALRQVMAVLRG
jgi:transposase